MMEREILYKDGETTLKGILVSPDSSPKPGVLVAHAWGGRSELFVDEARTMAQLGYTAFAIDMYGEAKTADTVEDCTALMTPFMEDRNLLLSRMQSALITIEEQPEVNTKQTAAIGFCFGGMCVLDLARSGSDVNGVVSFHGLLGAPSNTKSVSANVPGSVSAKILVLHGYDDPMATPEALTGFATEMSEAQADWQIHAYGNTLHAFTNPNANDRDFGTLYQPDADRRSRLAARNFLAEVFGG